MARDYVAYALDNSPPWLHGTWGEKLIRAIGTVFNDAYNAAFQAGAAGLLDAPTFPVDALAPIGNERNIDRYPGETNDHYHTRVKNAWASWTQAGTMRLVTELGYLGLTAEIKENHTAGWDWDGDAANWSRIWIVITDHDWEPIHFGDSGLKLGDNGVIGCDATANEASTLLRLIRKWKPGHVLPITLVLIDMGEGSWSEPDGTWDDPAERSPHALYHFER